MIQHQRHFEHNTPPISLLTTQSALAYMPVSDVPHDVWLNELCTSSDMKLKMWCVRIMTCHKHIMSNAYNNAASSRFMCICSWNLGVPNYYNSTGQQPQHQTCWCKL